MNPEATQENVEALSDTLTIVTVSSVFLGVKPVTLVAGIGSTTTGYIAAAMDENPRQALVTEFVANATGQKLADATTTIVKGAADISKAGIESNLVDGSKEFTSDYVSSYITDTSNGGECSK
ncbi:hypothetical protein [Vibrio sinaloensis]|uniref:hypothetical protein n=1 Tax=Photobacterium sp. (strain ATCC 43367) TaxID=379097 RepID=UPI0022B008CB|nr:hypothetical protein [Vibrio sinaloensis]MCZ4295791.1 hypothetical protein [Vibrio sinaloensis]